MYVLIYIFCVVVSKEFFFLLFAHSLIEYKSFLNRFFLLIDRTLTGTTTPGQSQTNNNGNEGVFHTLQIFITMASPSDAV